MNAIELKAEILDLVSREESVEKLAILRAFLRRFLDDLSTQSDWWDELTAEQQQMLELASKHVRQKKNQVSHVEVTKMLEGWRRREA